MAIFLDPRGRSTFGIALCARCSRKFFIDELSPDPNSPGLMVCKKDLDELDPYRLPARITEDITLPFTRPDRKLTGHAVAYDDLVYLVDSNTDSPLVTEIGLFILADGFNDPLP